MGSFDILIYEIKCPKCKKKREWGIQFKTLVDDTRSLENYPKYFDVEDTIATDDSIIFGIGNCPNCNLQKNILIKVKNNFASKEYEFDNRIVERLI